MLFADPLVRLLAHGSSHLQIDVRVFENFTHKFRLVLPLFYFDTASPVSLSILFSFSSEQEFMWCLIKLWRKKNCRIKWRKRRERYCDDLVGFDCFSVMSSRSDWRINYAWLMSKIICWSTRSLPTTIITKWIFPLSKPSSSYKCDIILIRSLRDDLC